jgi:hypothetical protein
MHRHRVDAYEERRAARQGTELLDGKLARKVQRLGFRPADNVFDQRSFQRVGSSGEHDWQPVG